MHADHQVELLHPLPERVELGQRERLATLPRGHRRHPDQEDLPAALVDVLELLDRGVVAVRERDDRRRVDGVGVDERPVLVHPLVQRVDDGDGHVGVVGHAFFEHARERRPQQRAVDAHLLHELEPGLRVEEGVDAGHDDHLRAAGSRHSGGPAVHAPAALRDVVAGGAGRRDLHERRVRDVVADRVPDRDLLPPVDVDVLDDTLVLRRQELRQRVPVLVEVVVGVERRVRQLPVYDLDEVHPRVAHSAPPCEDSRVSTTVNGRESLTIAET